jgi:hypothetical protein
MLSLTPKEQSEYNEYIRKHGRLPPIDHPTMGEWSDWGRCGRDLLVPTMIVGSVFSLVVWPLAFCYFF